MAKFRFRFETLLDQRKRIEDDRQREVAQLLRFRMIVEQELRQMQETIITSKRDLSEGLTGRVDLSRVSQFARYSGQVSQRAHTMVRKLAKIEEQIAEARQRLLAATRERKALDLLKDKQYQAWRLREERLETAQLDDLATQAYARQLGLT